MLSTDEIIIQILSQAKKDNNDLIKHFKISYPSNQVAQESNSIFVASANAEAREQGFEFATYLESAEILIVTKNKDYQKAMKIIKVVSREIIQLLLKNHRLFPNKPVMRNVTPEYNKDFVLTRGHIMVQCMGNPEGIENTEEEKLTICQILAEEEKQRMKR